MKILLSLYALLVVLFVGFSFLFIDPGLFYLQKIYSGIALIYRDVAVIAYVFFICTFFIFYLRFLHLSKMGFLTRFHVLLLIAISSFLLFSYPAMLSFDIFNYITTAKVAYFYKENPYVVMPIEFINEPYLSFTHAANKLALYGPVWILITAIPFFLGFGNFIFTLYLFKLLIFIFYLLTVFLIWKKKDSLFYVVFFALNPLVLIESLVSGHNDIVVMFFAVFALVLIAKKQNFISFFVLLTSFLMKYVTAVLFPLFLYTGLKKLKNKEINIAKISKFASIFMFLVVFIAGPIREEIYPWYAIWFISFAALSKSRISIYACIAISFGLLFRYVPFMYTGSHFGMTPIIKSVVTFLPICVLIVFMFLKHVWERKTLLR